MGLRFDHHAGTSSGSAGWVAATAATERRSVRNELSIVTTRGNSLVADFLGTFNRPSALAPLDWRLRQAPGRRRLILDPDAIDAHLIIAQPRHLLRPVLFPHLDADERLNLDKKARAVERRRLAGGGVMIAAKPTGKLARGCGGVGAASRRIRPSNQRSCLAERRCAVRTSWPGAR